MAEFLVRSLIALALSAAIYFGVEAFGHWIAYWAALLIAAVFVFGGWLILGDDAEWWT